MRIALTICLLLTMINAGFSQITQDNYIPLQSEGTIPRSIMRSAEEKYKSQAGTIFV